MTNFSVYVHVPWCKRRCPYCNFYFVVGRPQANFVDALIREFIHRRGDFSGGVTSLYFGGGTPSVLPPRELARFMEFLEELELLASDAEITLEANPEDLTEDYVKELARTPINRISLGVQSFDDAVLRRLGRKHSSEEAKASIMRLVNHGLTNISVDQIVGVPHERTDAIIAGLRFVHDAGVNHISTYLLTIEEGTKFHRSNISPSDDAQADVYLMVQRELNALGYDQYDISSYAKPGFMSRHNQAYWSAEDYIGLGPGAHSMRKLKTGGIERAHNHADVTVWLADPLTPQHWTTERLTGDEALREALAFGLRNMERGMDAERLAALFGAPIPATFSVVMTKYQRLGWLRKRDQAYVIAPEGALFADAIMRDILSC